MPTKKRRRTKLSEGVIHKQRPAIDIEKSAISNAAPVATDLEPFLIQGLPEGAVMPDLELLQIMFGNIVRKHSEEMEASDEAHFEALSRLHHLQLVRDDFKSRLGPKLSDIRDTFDTAFGENTCQRILGLGVNIPGETLRMRRVGDRVVRRLTAPGFELPPRVSDIAGVDVEKWVQELTPDLDGLRETMDEISAAKRESERTLEAKTRAVETYHTTFLRCSQMLETFYRVSGNEHLADKLRPPTPKTKKSAPPSDGEPSDQTETSDETAGDAEPDGGDTAPPESATDVDGGEGSDVEGPRPAVLFAPDRPGETASRVRPDRPPVEATSATPSKAEADV